jgi:hypothetical protein
MLAEAFVYAMSLAATPPRFRRHLYGAVGLWARGRRQASAWVPHMSNTRGLIDTAIDEFETRRTVAVLGSGPLFDVPLESLARTFGTVVLADQAHLWTSLSRERRYRNIRREWRDLSAATSADPLGFLLAENELDWVISTNLLSQIARTAPEGDEQRVIAAHLDALASLPCRTTLVTDVSYRIVDKGGQVIEEADMVYGYALPRPDLTWKWEVAPFGEEAPGTRRVHAVSAWVDWRKSLGANG